MHSFYAFLNPSNKIHSNSFKTQYVMVKCLSKLRYYLGKIVWEGSANTGCMQVTLHKNIAVFGCSLLWEAPAQSQFFKLIY